MSYSYKSYDPYEDEKYKKAKNALDAHGAYQPGDNYTKAMDYASKIENRKPFSYDINADALYQQYKDNYIQQGQMAMMDTMGQAAAMTGGYGNSYAQSVGQQVYNQQLNQLNNIVPELYGMAYSRYQQEGKDLQDAFNMYMGLEDRNKEHWDKEYNRLSAEEQNLYKRGYDEWNQKNTYAWNDYAASLKAVNPGSSYAALSADEQEKWRKNFGNTWNSFSSVWSNMKSANHDPLSSADFVLGEALDRGIKPTADDLDSFQAKLERAGMGNDEAAAYIAEWAVAFGLTDKKPQYTLKSAPGGRTSDFTVSNM